MKTVYIPKGETVHYESLTTEHLVVHGRLHVTYGVKAQSITGSGVIDASSINADTVCIDDVESGTVICKRLIAKRVQAPEVFASESAAVSCFLSAAYVETGKLTAAISEVDEVVAQEVVNLTPKKRTLFGTLFASMLRSFWTALTAPGQKAEVLDAEFVPAQEDHTETVQNEGSAEFSASDQSVPEVEEKQEDVVDEELNRIVGLFKLSREQGYSISREAFHLLFLNPPYLSVINESGGRSRHEKRFLIESLPALAYGGLLIYVIPYYRLTPDICRILVDNFDDLSVWRFTESEFRKFKQVAVLGIRKPRGTELQDTLWLEELASAPMSIRSLAEMPEERYALPDHPIEVNTFKGERFNQKELEQQLRRCNSFAQMMARSELDSGVKRPLLPLSISQIGLIGGSGMINGLIACDTPHIIKGRIVKVIRTESEEKFSAQGNHIGSEVKETITNKMIFNVLTPNGFKALT